MELMCSFIPSFQKKGSANGTSRKSTYLPAMSRKLPHYFVNCILGNIKMYISRRCENIYQRRNM